MELSPLSVSEITQVQDFVLAERRKCLSEREWAHRLRGYGYGLREDGRQLAVIALLGNADLVEIDKAVLYSCSASNGSPIRSYGELPEASL